MVKLLWEHLSLVTEYLCTTEANMEVQENSGRTENLMCMLW